MKKRTLLYGGSAGAIAASLLAATPAFAAGTQAGDTVTNSVTVTYEVNDVPQDPETADDTVVVDRKIDLTVARLDNTPTDATPGQTTGGAAAAAVDAVTYSITNDSNDTLDFQLAGANTAAGAIFAGTDNFDVTGGFIFYDDSGSSAGVWDATDAVITHLNGLAPDTPVTVHVRSNIPAAAPDGGIAGVELTATARENDNGAAVGSAITADAVNTAGEDTIFADTDRDGFESDVDAYIIDTAEIAVTKTSKVVASPIAGDTSGTYIPGATVEYCILVTNNSATVGASSVAISDDISGLPLTFSTTALGGTGNSVAVGGVDCDTYGTTAGAEAAGVVSGTITSVPTSSSRSVIFRATID